MGERLFGRENIFNRLIKQAICTQAEKIILMLHIDRVLTIPTVAQQRSGTKRQILISTCIIRHTRVSDCINCSIRMGKISIG